MGALVPKDTTELIQYCEAFSQGIMAMTGAGNPETAKVIMLTCVHEGISPLDYSRKYHTIKGKPTKRYDRMLVEFEELGHSYEIEECSSQRCAIKFIKKNGSTTNASCTWDEVRESRWPWRDPDDHNKGLKDNWSTPEDRETQMFARLVSKWIRRLAPSIVAGIYTPEEMEDIDGEVISSTVVESSPAASDVLRQQMEANVAEAKEDLHQPNGEDPGQPPADTQTATRDEPAMISQTQLQRLDDLMSKIKWTPELIDEMKKVANNKPKETWSFDFAKQMIGRLESLAGNL